MRTILALTLTLLLTATIQAATTITATLTFTNSANLTNAVAISNALLTVNGDTRKYTNTISSPATQIRITTSIGTNIQQQVAQTVAHVALYKFTGLTPNTDGSTYLSLRGTNDQAVVMSISPTNWASITYSTQTVAVASVLQVPASNSPTAVATNLWTMAWDALLNFSQHRDWSTAFLSSSGGRRIGTYGITNDLTLTTNYYWIGVTPTSGPVKITLPLANTCSNQVFIIADEWGAAGTNTITVTNAGTDRIRGALAVGISNNFGALFLLSRGGTNFSATRWNALEPYGEANTASNLGQSNATVKPVFLNKSAVDLRFFSMEQGSNAVIYMTPTSAVFNAVGEINTITNMGQSNATVKPVFLDKNSVTLRLFSLEQGTNVSLYMTPTSIVVNATIDTLGKLTDVANTFTGLADGDVLTYVAAMGQWTNAPPPGAAGGEANTGSNLGNGWPTYDSKSGVALQFNTWTNGPGLLSSSNSHTLAMRLDTTIKLDNSLTTNSAGRLRSPVDSTATTNQIDWANGPGVYYWTNMVTNVVLQVTNVWTAGVTNRTVDFWFTGATNNGPNFTVLLSCPNPAGVNFRWGWNSTTNGNVDLTVTNNQRAGLTLTLWETNVAEAYWSPVR